MKPYYQDNRVTIYQGDCREIIPSLEPVAAVVTDPPYGETSLKWDKWPNGWPSVCLGITNSLWCFGSLRMLIDKSREFEQWRMSQDIVWEKHNGTNPFNDRFRRVHELAAHFYLGDWSEIYKNPIYRNDATKRTVRRKGRPPHWGEIGSVDYNSKDGGPRLECSVLYVRSCHGSALHPTQKPEGIIRPLVEYSVPIRETVLDPFMGSGTTLRVAVDGGRRAIGIEGDERYCEVAAKRLSQQALEVHSSK